MNRGPFPIAHAAGAAAERHRGTAIERALWAMKRDEGSVSKGVFRTVVMVDDYYEQRTVPYQ